MSYAKCGALVALVALSSCGGAEENAKKPKDRREASAAAVAPVSPSSAALQPTAGGSIQPTSPGGGSATYGFDCQAACNMVKGQLARNFEVQVDCEHKRWAGATTCEECLEVLRERHDVQIEGSCSDFEAMFKWAVD